MSVKQPEYEREYSVSLGRTLRSPSDGQLQFHHIQYNIKPKSLDTSKPANVYKSSKGVRIQYNHANNPNEKYNYDGIYKPCKESECILIFENGKFTLERQTSNVHLKKQEGLNFVINTPTSSQSSSPSESKEQSPPSKKAKSLDDLNETYVQLSPHHKQIPASQHSQSIPTPTPSSTKPTIAQSGTRKRSNSQLATAPPPVSTKTVPIPAIVAQPLPKLNDGRPTTIKPPVLPGGATAAPMIVTPSIPTTPAVSKPTPATNSSSVINSSLYKVNPMTRKFTTATLSKKPMANSSSSINNEEMDSLVKDLELSLEENLENEMIDDINSNLMGNTSGTSDDFGDDEDFEEYPVQQQKVLGSSSTSVTNNKASTSKTVAPPSIQGNKTTTTTITDSEIFDSLNESYGQIPPFQSDLGQDIDFGQGSPVNSNQHQSPQYKYQSPPHSFGFNNNNSFTNSNNNQSSLNTNTTTNSNNDLVNQSIDSNFASESDSYTDDSDSSDSESSSSDYSSSDD